MEPLRKCGRAEHQNPNTGAHSPGFAFEYAPATLYLNYLAFAMETRRHSPYPVGRWHGHRLAVRAAPNLCVRALELIFV